MAYEVPTVRIQNPDNADDYIVIAQSDFDPAQGHRLFQGGTQSPLVDDPQPGEYPQAALIAEALDVTVARLGPWLAEQGDIGMLVRLLDMEKRASAKALINSRINALKKDD